MSQIGKPSAQQVVFVSDETGRVVYTHQFVAFGDVPPLDHDQMRDKALDAARSAHGHSGDGWTAAMSSHAELEQHRASQRRQPPTAEAS